MIEHLLKEIGLSDNEIKLYLTLLKNKRITYTQLADLSAINRTTCYGVVKKLIEYGLAKEDLAGPVVHIIPLPPSNLVEKLGKDQARLIKQVELAKRATTELEKIIPQGSFVEPKICYIEEDELEEYLYQRTDTWDKSMNKYDKTMWGFQDSLFEKRFKDYILWYWTRPLATGMKLKYFSDDATYSKEFVNPSQERILKYWPEMVDFSASTWVYGDYVVILSIQERPNYLLEINEPLLAANMRQFFKVMWHATEKVWGNNHVV